MLAQGMLKPDADILVLDEADQMLDLGFKEDLERLVKDLGSEVARWCFSATFPSEVQQVLHAWLESPRTVRLDTKSTSSHVPGRYVIARRGEERQALGRLLHLLAPARAMVFVRTREDVEGAVRAIAAEGIEAAGISGELAQEARERVLARFRDGHLPVLVGTDVAARGIDVPGVTHVFSLGLPMGAEAYSHRIGRTARAGASGEAWSVITPMERGRFLRLVQQGGGQIEERPLPTGVALVAAKRERLAIRVADGVGEARPLPPQFAALVTEHGAVEVLSALVHRLIPDAAPERPLPSASGAKRSLNAGPSRGAGTALFIGMGFEDGAGPGNIVAMLCRIPGITSERIGQIRCLARHTLVEVDPTTAEAILSARLNHRGRPVPVRPDRGGPSSAPVGRPPYRPRH
jgi:ATP-dependent RNA helicase DeaD